MFVQQCFYRLITADLKKTSFSDFIWLPITRTQLSRLGCFKNEKDILRYSTKMISPRPFFWKVLPVLMCLFRLLAVVKLSELQIWQVCNLFPSWTNAMCPWRFSLWLNLASHSVQQYWGVFPSCSRKIWFLRATFWANALPQVSHSWRLYQIMVL